MNVTIDLITQDPKRDSIILVAVEEGPWPSSSIEEQLIRVQNKLLDYVDIAVGGQLARRYPDSIGRQVIIRLDSYDTPREATEQLFFRIAEYVHGSTDIQATITKERYISGIAFEINQRSLPKEG
jgi:hypothetical protein